LQEHEDRTGTTRTDEEMGHQVDDELCGVLASTVAALGLELVDAEVHAGLLRVVVDRSGGADVDSIAEATRAISAVLDRHDPQPGRRYTLEVSSPGVERPLRAPRQFAKAIGEIVTLRTVTGSQGERRVRGRLAAVDEDGFVIEGEGLGDDGRRFSYDEVERARTVFEWPVAAPSVGMRPGASKRRGVMAQGKVRAKGAGRSATR
jgi:ribosome maturation factor RimP